MRRLVNLLCLTFVVLAAFPETRPESGQESGSKTNLGRTAAAPTVSTRAADGDARFVTGEVLVSWRGGMAPDPLPERVLGLLDTSSRTGIARLQVAPGEELETARRLAEEPTVAWAQPDYVRRPAYTVNDARFHEQWSLPRIRVPEAWDLTLGAAFVVVAVIDSGVDLLHPDLRDQLVEGFNFLDPGTPPQDDAGHGTHAAGLIAASTGNGIGIAGVAPRAMIMPLKALDSTGLGKDSVVAEAMAFAVDHGAWVINMSFNGREQSPALEEAVAYATARGTILVVAAGNDSLSDPSYPGAIKPAVAVAATSVDDLRPTFTNYGPWVDLAAPGQSILSTSWHATDGSGYKFESGTSAAAPLVTGVVALMFSLQPALTVEQIVTTLRATADHLEETGVGAGRVNAARAVRAVAPAELLTPTVPPASPTPIRATTPAAVSTLAPMVIVTPGPSPSSRTVAPSATVNPSPVGGFPPPLDTPVQAPTARTASPTPNIPRLTFTPGRV